MGTTGAGTGKAKKKAQTQAKKGAEDSCCWPVEQIIEQNCM